METLVAGGGIAGVLSAVRAAHILGPPPSPEKVQVAILEKEDVLGGRARTASSAAGSGSTQTFGGVGLWALHEDLLQFWQQTIQLDPSTSLDLGSFASSLDPSIGILQGTSLEVWTRSNLFSNKGAKFIGGLAAQRDWGQWDTWVAKATEDPTASLSTLWASATRQSAAAAVVRTLGPLLGLADPWTSASEVVLRRAHALQGNAWIGDWGSALAETYRISQPLGVKAFFGFDIAAARWHAKDGWWEVQSRSGTVRGRRLVVAQSPWEAAHWLPQEYWPAEIAALATKARPTTAVVLSEKLAAPSATLTTEDVPATVLVPAEEVAAYILRGRGIVYQAVLDYEASMDHPLVTKAIKRLRRARAKLHAALPGLESSGEHLSLVPAAWTDPPLPGDRRWLNRLTDRVLEGARDGRSRPKKDGPASGSDGAPAPLAFCGDTYGPAGGDANLIHSVAIACPLDS